MHRAARDNPRRLDLDPRPGDVGQRTFTVDRLAQRVDDAPQQAATDRHVDNRAGALDDVALVDAAVLAEHDDTDIVALEVERHAAHPIGESDHLAGLDRVKAIDASNPVADRQHLADFCNIRLAAELGDFLLEDRRNLRRANFHQNLFSGRPKYKSIKSRGYSSFPRTRESRARGPERLPWTPAFAGVTSPDSLR